MAEQTKLVPKRRFKEFQNTQAWERSKLGDFVTIKSGWSPSNFVKSDDQNGSLFIKVDDLNYSSREQIESNMKVQDNSRFIKMKKGSTIFPKRGAAIMTNKVRILASTGYMDTNMMALEPESIDGEFLYSFIESKGLYKIADTSTIPQINNKHIEPYVICLPRIDEQKKISEFFKQLDSTITLHQRKLEKLTALKSAYLSEMFPAEGECKPKRRFTGFTQAWEQRKLRDLANFSKGTGYSKSDLINEGKPIILYGRLYTNYETVIESVDTFTIEKENSVISRGGEVIVPSSGETSQDISRASVVREAGIILGGDLNVIRTNEGIDSIFLALTISNGTQQKELSKRAQGKSVVHLHNTDLKEVDLIFPEKKEQAQIGRFFKQLDDTITLHQRKLEKLQNIKKAYLNEMFI